MVKKNDQYGTGSKKMAITGKTHSDQNFLVIRVCRYIYKHVHVHIRWKCRNVQCKPSEFNLTSWDVRSVLVEPWRKKDLKLLSADLTSHYVSLPSQDAWRTWHQHAPGCLWRAHNIKVKKCIVNNYIYTYQNHTLSKCPFVQAFSTRKTSCVNKNSWPMCLAETKTNLLFQWFVETAEWRTPTIESQMMAMRFNRARP